jgi:ABC-2 type transport system permease protein
MLTHCWVLFALKWTLVRRGWNKRDFWGYVVVAFLLFLGSLLSLGLSVIFYLTAFHVSREQSQVGVVLLLNGAIIIYLFFFVWGVLMDLQRSDMIDFRKMLLLPVSLPMIYLMNFLVSIASPIMLFAIPGLVGLLAGFYTTEGVGIFLVGIPLALLFMFMMSAWAYYLRGRLAIIMENKRRRRLALVILPLCFVALGQLPALLSHLAVVNSDQLFAKESLPELLPYILMGDALVPLFWPVYGIWLFMNGAAPVFVWGIALGLCLCTLLGLRFGYISTLNHYMGLYSDREESKRQPQEQGRAVKVPRTSRHLPFCADDTAALVLAFYYSFSRHPHVRMLIIMPLCLGLFFLFMYRTGAYGGYLEGEASLIPMAALVWPFLNFSLFLFNIFGVDAQSFHALAFFPTQRRKYIIAKNLALAPFVLGMSFFFIAVSALLVWAPVRMIVLSLLLAVHLYLLFATIGNYLSLYMPYRINRDALRQPTRRLRMILVGLGSTLLVAVMVLPASLCMYLEKTFSDRTEYFARNAGLLGAFSLFILVLALYWFTLTTFGDQFSVREQLIYSRICGDRE